MTKIDEIISGNCTLYLEKVKYARINETEEEVVLIVNDDIEVRLDSNFQGIEGVITRKLSFEPKSLFEVEVSFGVFLEFNDDYKGVDTWDMDELKREFLDGQCVITNSILSRISLLISQLTSSYGERPIVTPPSIMK